MQNLYIKQNDMEVISAFRTCCDQSQDYLFAQG